MTLRIISAAMLRTKCASSRSIFSTTAFKTESYAR